MTGGRSKYSEGGGAKYVPLNWNRVKARSPPWLRFQTKIGGGDLPIPVSDGPVRIDDLEHAN